MSSLCVRGASNAGATFRAPRTMSPAFLGSRSCLPPARASTRASTRMRGPRGPTVASVTVLRHTVQPGENLTSIARLHTVAFQSLKDANAAALANAKPIQPGQVLLIPQIPLPATTVMNRDGSAAVQSAGTAAPPPLPPAAANAPQSSIAPPLIVAILAGAAAVGVVAKQLEPRDTYAEFMRAAGADVNFMAEKDGELEVTLLSGESLGVGPLSFNSDPYVVVSLDGVTVRSQRGVGNINVKDARNPVWNQQFILPVGSRESAGPVKLEVRDSWATLMGSVGEGDFDLAELEVDGDPKTVAVPIKAARLGLPRGEIMMEVSYRSTAQGRRTRVEVRSIRDWS